MRPPIRTSGVIAPSANAVKAMLARVTAIAWLSSVILIPPSFGAGYAFSVSADSANPFVDTAPPSNGIRNLYLWATCAENGLSALEAAATGSLQVDAFHPLHGVVNAGHATTLLLAVPDCPQGPDVHFLLGKWVVQDTGGTLCLGPADESGTIACVDCAPNPSVWDDPKVVGFASSGTPCETGDDDCGREELSFGASFQEIAVLEGSLPNREPWSPTEPLLAFNGKDGLYTFDASKTEPPQKISESTVLKIEWSPDGKWLLFIPEVISMSTTKSLDAVSIEGGEIVRILEPIPHDMGHFVWATDGYIYFWNSDSGARGRLDPPDAWRRGLRGSLEPVERVVLVRHPLGGAVGAGLWPCFFEPTRAEREILTPGRETDPSLYVLLEDECPSRRRFLGAMFGDTRPTSTVILDYQGRVVRDFGPLGPEGGFSGTSVSANGRYVIGTSDVTDGHYVFESTLWLADLKRDAPVRIDGVEYAMQPKFSHSTTLELAFMNRDGTEIHVGRLDISSRSTDVTTRGAR